MKHQKFVYLRKIHIQKTGTINMEWVISDFKLIISQAG